MGILTGSEIKKEAQAGNILITPYNEELVNVASVDLTLGDGVVEYTAKILDPKELQQVRRYALPKDGGRLDPGRLYLMHTVESLHTKKYAGMLNGKSSLGRLGTIVHLTAGYIDPGFNGQCTLEVTVVKPVILYPGMRICQLTYHTLVGDIEDYSSKGHYTADLAKGAVPSQAHRQFQ